MDYPRLTWRPDLIKKFWDYQAVHGTGHYFGKMAATPLLRKVRKYLPKESVILDYGCGPGYLLDVLLEQGYRVFGYDASPHSIAVAQKRLSTHPRVLGFSSQDIPASTFDAVFALELIEHLDDSELERALNAFKKLLKPAGHLILSTPYNENLLENTVYCPECNHTFHKMQHVRSWTESSLADCLNRFGFRGVDFIRADLTACYSWRPWVRLRYWLGWVPPTNLICVARPTPA